MKLWKKISLLTGVILFIAMGIFGGGMLYKTWQYNREQTIESWRSQMKVNAYVIAQEINNNPLTQFSEVTKKSFLNFTVQKYGGTDYILLKNGEEMVNQTNYTFVKGEESRFEQKEPEYVIQKTEGVHLLVMGQMLSTERKEPYQLILVKDISELYQEMKNQIWMFVVLYLVILFFAVDIVFWLVRMVLKPLTELETVAMAISMGEWKRRIRVRRNDEVGKVSVAFNQMADRVESQMVELNEVSERRRQLLGSLTHELKTPMTSIIGYSDTLLHMKLSGEQQKKSLEHINAQCRRLERLSGKMMSLIGLYDEDRINKVPYSIETLFGNVANLEKYHMQDAGMKLVVSHEGGERVMDPDLMESLLVNLLDNAIKASKPGSVIELKAEGNRFFVRDYGKGIPAEEIPRITEAFYMVDKSRSRQAGGIGMGLALCQRIAEIHGAFLEIQSTLGEGTTISVVFQEETA